jgi:hypothetical protein
MLHKKLLYLLIVTGELSVMIVTFRIVFLTPEHLTPWCVVLCMLVAHCDDQNVNCSVLDDSHFLVFLMQLSISSTSYWASNSFAKEFICHLVIFCFGHVRGLMQAFAFPVPIFGLIILFYFYNVLKL